MVLDDLVSDAIQTALQSDAIKDKVQKAAEKAVSEAIDSAFGYSSQFRKQIEAAIKEVLPIVKMDDLVNFANASREVLQRRLLTMANETAAAYLNPAIDKMLPKNPTITLVELREAYVRKLREESNNANHCHCDDDDDYEPEYLWSVTRSGSESTKNYWRLAIAADPDSSEYGSKVIRLSLRDIEGGLAECWNVTIHGEEMNAKMFGGPLFGFDALLFQLATGLVKVKQCQLT